MITYMNNDTVCYSLTYNFVLHRCSNHSEQRNSFFKLFVNVVTGRSGTIRKFHATITVAKIITRHNIIVMILKNDQKNR